MSEDNNIILKDKFGQDCEFEVGQLYEQFIERGDKIFGFDFKGIMELRKAMMIAAVPMPFTEERIIKFLKGVYVKVKVIDHPELMDTIQSHQDFQKETVGNLEKIITDLGHLKNECGTFRVLKSIIDNITTQIKGIKKSMEVSNEF